MRIVVMLTIVRVKIEREKGKETKKLFSETMAFGELKKQVNCSRIWIHQKWIFSKAWYIKFIAWKINLHNNGMRQIKLVIF